jgi:hypothetical protein
MFVSVYLNTEPSVRILQWCYDGIKEHVPTPKMSEEENFLETIYIYSFEGKCRWSRIHLQSLAPTNPHWARVVSYGPFSLCVIYKEGIA